MRPSDRTETVVKGLRESAKYRHLCTDTLRRIAEWSLDRHPREKDALKAAKRKLHQVYAAYLQAPDFDQIDALLDDIGPGSADLSDNRIRSLCREILASHVSSAERLGFIDRVYDDLFTRTGRPASVLDVACGLNPFSLPWMQLQPATPYRCIDIDSRQIDVANRFLRQYRPNASAACQDVLADNRSIEADIVLLLKAVPCLEQQVPGSAAAILDRIEARHVIISFPSQSLGGTDRGMRGHYSGVVEKLCSQSDWLSECIHYPTESFYLLHHS